MKTNDVTGRFTRGWAGVALEMGRPGVGTSFRDMQTVAMAIARLGVEFEPNNPVAELMSDPKTGKFHEAVLNERVLSAIIELKIPVERLKEVLEVVREVSGRIDTAFSLDLISRLDPDGGHAGPGHRPGGRLHPETEYEDERGARPAAVRGRCKMTHTLHRQGNPEDLQEDYVLLLRTSRFVNHEGSEETMRRVWEVISHYEKDLVNFGNHNPTWGGGELYDMEFLKTEAKSRIIHAVFKDRETIKACLKELKEADLGISTVVSGLCGETEKICAEIGLAPHTVNYSLGIHGKTEKVPQGEVLEIHTLCGHAMVVRQPDPGIWSRRSTRERSPARRPPRSSPGCATAASSTPTGRRNCSNG